MKSYQAIYFLKVKDPEIIPGNILSYDRGSRKSSNILTYGKGS